MLKAYQSQTSFWMRLADALVIAGIWLGAYPLRFSLPLIPITKGFPEFSRYSALTPFLVVLWMFVFSSMGVYRNNRLLRRTDEAHLVLRAHLVAFVTFVVMTFLVSEYRYSRVVLVYFGLLSGFLFVALRLSVRNSLRALRRKGFHARNAVLIGEGLLFDETKRRLLKYPELGLKLVGEFKAQDARKISEMSVPVHHVLVALPRSQVPDLEKILSDVTLQSADLSLVPDYHEYITLGCQTEDFHGLPVVHLNDSPLDTTGVVVKRLTDIVCSSIMLLVLSPFLLLIALLIRVFSPGPIFYKQERMGLDGRTFNMLKFRTMAVDAEKDGAVWARPNDTRRTGIGAILRSTSVDELPQLVNVLRGDMSLVGPRPERPIFVERFRTQIPNYMLRHKVKAGITGWAQVNGWRGDTSLDRRIEFDLYYIRNWSYSLDWKILFMTLWRGFVNKNAY